MKIWWQNSSQEGPGLRRVQKDLSEHLNKIKRPDTEISYHGTDQGSLDFHYNFVVYLNTAFRGGMLDKVIQAEQQGYDGVAIGCFLDPGLYEAREVCNIPVLSLAETAMLTSCMLGRKFSVVAFADKQAIRYEDLARSYGLQDRIVPFVSMGIDLETQNRMYAEEPKKLVELFISTAEKAVKAGAEVILPGCGGLDTMCWKYGIKDVDGALVLDCNGVLLKITEAMVDLHKLAGIQVSRRLLYTSPAKEALTNYLRLYGLTE